MLSFSHVNSRLPDVLCTYDYSVFLCHIPFSSVSEDIMVLPFKPSKTQLVDYCWHLSLLPSPTNLVRTCPTFSKLKHFTKLSHILESLWGRIITEVRALLVILNDDGSCFLQILWLTQRPLQFDLHQNSVDLVAMWNLKPKQWKFCIHVALQMYSSILNFSWNFYLCLI